MVADVFSFYVCMLYKIVSYTAIQLYSHVQQRISCPMVCYLLTSARGLNGKTVWHLTLRSECGCSSREMNTTASRMTA